MDPKRCEHCGKAVPYPVGASRPERVYVVKKYCSKNCHSYAYQYRLRNGFGARKVDELRRAGKLPPL